jgi:heat shock protein HslJ
VVESNEVKPRFKQLNSTAILLLILFLLVGCGQATSTVDPLGGTSWVLLSLYGKPPIAGTHITLAFSGGYVSGFAGCNDYFGLDVADKYTVTEDGSLTIPGFAIHLLACSTPEGVMDQEDVYCTALRSAVTYRLVENRLEIEDATGDTILVFSR